MHMAPAATTAPEGHDLKGNNDLLLLTRPQIIADIHTAYLEAGADLVETNTFNATSVSQADYHLEHLVYELNKAGAAVARACCDAVAATTPGKPRFVIGVIGPTSRTASISPDVNDPGFRNTSFDELRDTYREAIEGLIDGAPTPSWSRPSSTRSMPRRRCMRWKKRSTRAAHACR